MIWLTDLTDTDTDTDTQTTLVLKKGDESMVGLWLNFQH